MTRSISVRDTVALALVLLVLAASAPPVGAMNAQAQADGFVVGSEHDSAAELQNAQELTNLTVEGTGDAASVTLGGGATTTMLESHEDGDLSEWGSPSGYTATTTRATDGAYSMQHQSGTDSSKLSRSVPSAAYNSTSVDVYFTGLPSQNTQSFGFGSSGSWGMQFAVDTEGNLQTYAGGFDDTGVDIQTGQWYTVRAVNIDYETDTFDVEVVQGGTVIATSTGHSFRNGGVDTISATLLRSRAGEDWYNDAWTGTTIEAGGTPTTATYISAVHAVSNAESAAINITAASNVSVDLSVEAHMDDGSWFTADQTTITSPGNHTLSPTSASSDEWRIRADVTVTGENPQFALADESILFTPHAPDASNFSPADNATLSTQETTLSVDVTDEDFQTAQGDEVSVTFKRADGTVLGTETLTSSGTASTNVTTLGETSWYVVLEDEYGQQVQTSTRTFNTPNTLRVLDELNPQELVDDNVTVTIRAYAGDTALSREVTDGTANLTGFPMDQPVVITTSAEGWVDRRIIIEDLTEQQRIYLLNESANTVPITFQLSDKTGSFPPESSRLQIQKAINVTGTAGLEWQTITGDYFAADLKFPTTLAGQQRYRIDIENEQGDQRILGSYIPYEPTATTLSIGEIVWDIPETNGVYSTSRIDDQDRLEVLYNDTAGATTRLNITAWNRTTGEEIYSAIEYDVQQSVTRVPVDTEDIVVSVQAEREGASDYNTTGVVGRPNVEQNAGFEKWLRLGSQVLMLSLAGFVIGQMPKKGGIIIVPLAFGVTWLGFWKIHPAALGLAGVMAIMSATNRGGY